MVDFCRPLKQMTDLRWLAYNEVLLIPRLHCIAGGGVDALERLLVCTNPDASSTEHAVKE